MYPVSFLIPYTSGRGDLIPNSETYGCFVRRFGTCLYLNPTLYTQTASFCLTPRNHSEKPYSLYGVRIASSCLLRPNSILFGGHENFIHKTDLHLPVSLHKHVLDHLGVKSVAVVVGGSMGGMAVLEWPLCTPPGYIRHVVPIATSARHSAWCISWGEAQRQSIYSDPIYEDGYYSSQPASGLAAARMAALLTYRSRDSFESRFGRNAQVNRTMGASASAELITPPRSPVLSPDDARQAHNDGLRNSKPRPSSRAAGSISEGSASSPPRTPASPPPIFSAQGYLRYQGDKFTARFDANCYIHITRKMDTHDLARGRVLPTDSTTTSPSSVAKSESDALAKVLARLPPRALVIGIQTDGLFTTTEQIEIASGIPDAELIIIPSPDGHDGFLLEFERINRHLMEFLRREFKEYYVGERGEELEVVPEEGFDVKKTSMFGEAEADIAAW